MGRRGIEGYAEVYEEFTTVKGAIKIYCDVAPL
jgi:hypothetical protein